MKNEMIVSALRIGRVGVLFKFDKCLLLSIAAMEKVVLVATQSKRNRRSIENDHPETKHLKL